MTVNSHKPDHDSEIKRLQGELERVEGEYERARRHHAEDMQVAVRRIEAAESQLERLRAGGKELQGWVKERADEADRLHDQAVARDPRSHACAHSAGLSGAYQRVADKLPALLDQKVEGACETCGGARRLTERRRAPVTEQFYDADIGPCPDCSTGKQVEAGCSNCEGVDPASCFRSHVEGEAPEPLWIVKHHGDEAHGTDDEYEVALTQADAEEAVAEAKENCDDEEFCGRSYRAYVPLSGSEVPK